MLKHIVMWKLKATSDGYSREQNAHRIRQALEALVGRIDGLLELEVGINTGDENDAFDLVLYSVFRDQAAYAAYLQHPEHKAIVPLVKMARSDRACVDYFVTQK
jgi:quinol monooxygenase YgiN